MINNLELCEFLNGLTVKEIYQADDSIHKQQKATTTTTTTRITTITTSTISTIINTSPHHHVTTSPPSQTKLSVIPATMISLNLLPSPSLSVFCVPRIDNTLKFLLLLLILLFFAGSYLQKQCMQTYYNTCQTKNAEHICNVAATAIAIAAAT